MGVPGRPEKPIDWDRVEELAVSGCSGTEIASHFDIHYNNFYERLYKKHGVGFTEFRDEKRQKGDSLLRETQYKKALGLSEKGDNTLLIWLGKNRLKQSDVQLSDTAPEQEKLNVQHDNIETHANLVLAKEEIKRLKSKCGEE